jgi:hypothetical protein
MRRVSPLFQVARGVHGRGQWGASIVSSVSGFVEDGINGPGLFASFGAVFSQDLSALHHVSRMDLEWQGIGKKECWGEGDALVSSMLVHAQSGSTSPHGHAQSPTPSPSAPVLNLVVASSSSNSSTLPPHSLLPPD